MEKKKAFLVTILLAVLTAAVWACLWKISDVGFAGITAFFSGIGFFGTAVNVFHWMAKAPKVPVDKLDIPEIHHEEETLEPINLSEYELSYDAIREEVASL